MDAIIRRSPNRTLTVFEPLYRPFNLLEEVEAMAREVFDGGLLHSLDVYEEKGELVVKAELPGIEKKELDISLEEDMLTIKAEKKQEEVAEDATYYVSERHFGQYFRTIALPFHVDVEKISATFKKGLLEIRLPKAEEAEAKHIEIKTK